MTWAQRTMNKEGLILQDGRIIDPLNGIDHEGSVIIHDGKLAAVLLGKADLTPWQGFTIIPLSGKWVVPGLIDMHVHLREPGEEYKETIASGTRAAAAGGFTAVACMPNTKPVNDNQAITIFIKNKAQEASCRVYPVGSISKGGAGETIAEFGDLKAAGVVAVSDDGRPVSNSQLMRRALEYAKSFNLLIISHSEDLQLGQNGSMNEGFLSAKLGLRGIPKLAEEVMIYRDIALAGLTGGKLHLAHVSTKESVALIRRAKEQGLSITAETAPHYFSLTEEAVDLYNTMAKMNPPLRTKEDMLAIQEGISDGTIDVVASDHAPHSELEKEVEFDLAANGIIGLETSVSLTLSLVRQGIISPRRFVEIMTVNPARILGVTGGSLTKGEYADVSVIDPEQEFIFSKEQIRSQSKNSPFLGCRLKGRAILTLKDGRITHQQL